MEISSFLNKQENQLAFRFKGFCAIPTKFNKICFYLILKSKFANNPSAVRPCTSRAISTPMILCAAPKKDATSMFQRTRQEYKHDRRFSLLVHPSIRPLSHFHFSFGCTLALNKRENKSRGADSVKDGVVGCAVRVLLPPPPPEWRRTTPHTTNSNSSREDTIIRKSSQVTPGESVYKMAGDGGATTTRVIKKSGLCVVLLNFQFEIFITC